MFIWNDPYLILWENKMDFETIDEILSTLSSNEKDQFKSVFSLLNEIKISNLKLVFISFFA